MKESDSRVTLCKYKEKILLQNIFNEKKIEK